MTDEKPEEDTETQDVPSEDSIIESPLNEGSDAEPDKDEECPRPYIRYTSAPRTGSIWNSPIGLLTTFFIASKVIDLAYRTMMEREKTKRAEFQKQQ